MRLCSQTHAQLLVPRSSCPMVGCSMLRWSGMLSSLLSLMTLNTSTHFMMCLWLMKSNATCSSATRAAEQSNLGFTLVNKTCTVFDGESSQVLACIPQVNGLLKWQLGSRVTDSVDTQTQVMVQVNHTEDINVLHNRFAHKPHAKIAKAVRKGTRRCHCCFWLSTQAVRGLCHCQDWFSTTLETIATRYLSIRNCSLRHVWSCSHSWSWRPSVCAFICLHLLRLHNHVLDATQK